MVKYTTLAGVLAASTVVAAQVTDIPPVSLDATSMFKYGATQGGLLLVVLVIMYMYRRDFMQEINQAHADRQVLIELVQDVTTALTKNIDAVEAQRKATERLADAFTTLASRRSTD